MPVTDAPDFETERGHDDASLFGIDLGFQDKELEVVDSIVVVEPPSTRRPPRTLTDRLAQAAADRVRWGQST
jgi:hypothetical protein